MESIHIVIDPKLKQKLKETVVKRRTTITNAILIMIAEYVRPERKGK